MQKDIAALTEAQFIRQFEPLMEEWDKMGYIDNKYAPPLASDYDRAVMAVVLENVKNYMVGSDKTVEQALEIARKAKEMFGDLAEATTPTTTTAWSGATNLPLVLGYIRKIMPKMFALNIVQVQPLTKPSGRVFTLNRIRHDDGSNVGTAEIRYGWSYRSWVDDPGEATAIAKSVKFEMTSADVSVRSRKLKAETGIEVNPCLLVERLTSKILSNSGKLPTVVQRLAGTTASQACVAVAA